MKKYKIAFYVDTSGSNPWLLSGTKQMRLIRMMTVFMHRKGVKEADIYFFDTSIHSRRKFKPMLGNIFHGLQATGGTDFNEIRTHSNLKNHNEVFIITDGCGAVEGEWHTKYTWILTDEPHLTTHLPGKKIFLKM